MSPKIPSFNIFIMMPSPDKHEKKEKEKKENKLAEALKMSRETDGEMLSTMQSLVKKTYGTSHAGGG